MTTNIVYAIKCRDEYVAFEDVGEYIEVRLDKLNLFTFYDIRVYSESSAINMLSFINSALHINNYLGIYDTTMITKLDYDDMKIVKLEVNFNFNEI